MEHIVQFAISIDDQTIQKRLEENAYDDIIDSLKKECLKRLPTVGYKQVVDWEFLARDMLRDFIDANRDAIIDAAADKLKDSFIRTKTYKEKMKEAMDEA